MCILVWKCSWCVVLNRLAIQPASLSHKLQQQNCQVSGEGKSEKRVKKRVADRHTGEIKKKKKNTQENKRISLKAGTKVTFRLAA